MFSVGRLSAVTVADAEVDPVKVVTSSCGSVWTMANEHTWYTAAWVPDGAVVTVTRKSGLSESKPMPSRKG
jgi:hypothetical protein